MTRTAELLRDVRELLYGSGPQPTPSTLQVARVTISDMSDVTQVGAAGGAGVYHAAPGAVLALSLLSHASAELEVAFGPRPDNRAAQWILLVPGSVVRPPHRGRFEGFRLRLGPTNPGLVQRAVFHVTDSELELELLGESGRFPQVSPTGGVVAENWVWTGAAWIQQLASAAGRTQVAPIPGQEGVAAGAGAVSALTQRTTLASDDPAVVSLAVLDDWDDADRCKVSPIPGQAGVAAGAGAVGATVPRVTLASDDPAVTALQIMDDWDSSDRCKVIVQPSPTTAAARVTVTNASTQISAANTTRRRLYLENKDSTESVSVAFGAAAVSGASTTYRLDAGDWFEYYGDEAVNAIRDGASDVEVHAVEETW